MKKRVGYRLGVKDYKIGDRVRLIHARSPEVKGVVVGPARATTHLIVKWDDSPCPNYHTDDIELDFNGLDVMLELL